MMKKLVTMGVFMALASSTVFADDTQTQMGQTQTITPGGTTTTTTTQPGMPSTATPQTVMPTTTNNQTVDPAQQTGAMPDTATGNADDVNVPTTPAPSSNY